MFLFDTNVLSEIIKPKGVAVVVARVLDTPPEQRFASEWTRNEMRLGAGLRGDGSRLSRRIASDMLPLATWLGVTAEVSLLAGDIAANLRREGRPCGAVDPLIAATALVHRCTLVTGNVKHFEHIPKLRVANWFP